MNKIQYIKFILPAVIIILSYTLLTFVFIIPETERICIEKEKESIKRIVELTTSMIDSLRKETSKSNSHIASDKASSKRALALIEDLRYGKNEDDYLWVLSSDGIMLEHPYRPDFEGQDMTDYQDKAGNFLIRKMVNIVENSGKGYLQYYWQMHDEKDNIEKKISYVTLYKPYNWIIGTGLYLGKIINRVRSMSITILIMYSLFIPVFIFLTLLLAYLGVRNEKKLDNYTRKLADSLNEKNTLLKEVHHRVKNNLQIISSLLNLQRDATKETAASEALRAAQNRISSMAYVHENLYKSEHFSDVYMPSFIQTVIRNLYSTYVSQKDNISIRYDIEGINIPISQAIPFGLILNEVCTNTFLHAFPNKQSGIIEIILNSTESGYHLLFKDNGVGFDPESYKKQEKLNGSLGMQLIHTLTNQLNGTIHIDSNKGNTTIEILFPIA